MCLHRQARPALWILSLAAVLAAQQPERPTTKVEKTPRPEQMCVVEGQAVKATTGEPLKKVWISLRRTENPEYPFTTTTGRDGKFLLRDVTPGRYRLWARKTGYVSLEYEQKTLRSPGSILSLAPGQHMKDISLRLLEGAVIAGRVNDEDGEPVAGVYVSVLHHGYWEGERRLTPAGGALTNDRGEYRAFGLAPGEYYLSAVIRGGWGATPSVGPNEGYAPVFYPGTTDPGSATPISVRPGEEFRADLTFTPVPAVRVRGQIVKPDGELGRGVMVGLVPRDQSEFYGADSTMASSRESDGSFELRNVTAGSYDLVAESGDAGRKRLFARQPVEVGSSSVEGLRVVLAPTLELDGSARFEGGNMKTAGVRISLQPKIGYRMGIEWSGEINADGTFHMEGLTENPYRLHVSGLPENAYVKAARLGNQDVLEAGLNMTRGKSATLELVIASNGGRIEGVVLNEQKEPTKGALVVLAPDADRRARQDLYKVTSSDQYGRFALKGIAPGTYKMFAWEDVEPGAYQDPDFLKKYEDRGVPVSVEGGGPQSVELKLLPAETAAQ